MMTLDDLIATINKKRPDDVLERVSDAVLLGEHLGELADHLIGHFVDQARRSGASWTDIGRSMGVSKQAAQKRFVSKSDPDLSQGFSRFSAPARTAVVTSMSEARRAGNVEIAPAHLLLALIGPADGLAARALVAQGLDLDAVRQAATAALPEGGGAQPELLPFDGRCRKVLELTFREALRLGDDGVGTGHILLALIEEEEPEGDVLTRLGVFKAAVEQFLAEQEPEGPTP
jgi:hypothetical protein